MAYVRDDPIAITIPLIADAPAYDDQPLGMTNLQWCERELARIHAKGNRQPHLRTPAQATRRSLRRKPFCLPVSTCAGVFFRS